MVKFVFNGGMTNRKTESNRQFFEEIFNISKNEVNVLLAFFSKSESTWPELYRDYTSTFPNHAPDKRLHFQLANVKDFPNQVKWADIIYFRGGDGKHIKDALIRFQDLRKMLEGKIVGGSSAGVNVFAKYYFDSDHPEKIEKGLGILPIKTICHFNLPINKNNYEKLKNYAEDLPIHALNETEYAVINL